MSSSSGGPPVPRASPASTKARNPLEHDLRSLKEHLESRMSLNYSPAKRFLPSGEARNVWIYQPRKFRRIFSALYNIEQDDYRLDRLLRRTLGSFDSPGLCNILAILVWIGPIEWFEKVFLPKGIRDDESLPHTDGELPFAKEKACRLLGSDVGDRFFFEQFLFCPIVLHQHEEAVYVGHQEECRTPYLCDDPIAQGSFGTVWKVEIQKGHFKFKGGKELSGARFYARKDFKMNKSDSFLEERKVLRQILQASRKHTNIMVTLGSLQRGNQYSLFFELAKCDLWYYLITTDAPRDKTMKQRIFHHAAGLAGALAHLHGLKDSLTLESVCCYHLDLKPQNILVVQQEDGTDIWKISDFGMSRVKRISMKNELNIDRMFEQQSTVNRRGDGTYLAPEAAKNGRVASQADIWSFGCVLSLIMTFVNDGKKGVEEFELVRGNTPAKTDQFYTVAQTATRNPTAWTAPDGDQVTVNARVLDWFDKLEAEANRRSSVEGLVFKETLRFLSTRVLLPNPDKRKMTKATDIEEKLESMFIYYRSSQEGSATPLQSPAQHIGQTSSRTPFPATPPVSIPLNPMYNKKAFSGIPDNPTFYKSTSSGIPSNPTFYNSTSPGSMPPFNTEHPSPSPYITFSPSSTSQFTTEKPSPPSYSAPSPGSPPLPQIGQFNSTSSSTPPGSSRTFNRESSFTSLEPSPPDIPMDLPSMGATTRRSSWLERRIAGLRGRPSTQMSRTIPLHLSGMNTCAFTARGDLLAFYSPKSIVVYSMDIVRRNAPAAEPAGRYEAPCDGRWAGFCFNSDYLCAFPSSDHFECYVYPLSKTSGFDGSATSDHWKVSFPQVSNPIKRMAISPNGEFIACAIDRSGDTLVYLFQTSRLLSQSFEYSSSGSSRMSRDSTLTSSSTGAIDLPWPNILQQSFDCGLIDEIKKELKFSTDSQWLTFIGKPKLEPHQRLTITVRAWRTSTGAYLGYSSLIDGGRNDLPNRLLTSITLFNRKRAFLAIRHQKSIYHYSFSENTSSEFSNNHSDLSDVLLSGDDSEAVFITTGGKAYQITASSIKSHGIGQPTEKAKADFLFKGYDSVFDSAVLFEDLDQRNQRRKGILVASWKGHLYEAYFDPP